MLVWVMCECGLCVAYVWLMCGLCVDMVVCWSMFSYNAPGPTGLQSLVESVCFHQCGLDSKVAFVPNNQNGNQLKQISKLVTQSLWLKKRVCWKNYFLVFECNLGTARLCH